MNYIFWGLYARATPMNNGIPIEYHMMRDNVASNLKLTPDKKNLILGIVNYGVWKADITGIIPP